MNESKINSDTRLCTTKTRYSPNWSEQFFNQEAKGRYSEIF